MKRHATAVWTGTGKEGSGQLTTQSGVLSATPYSASRRFGDEKGTNPEELIAAAHAGCFTMALAFALSREGFTPTELATTGTVTIEPSEGGFTITGSHLELTATIPGIDKEKFETIANGAKAGCPVSKALAGTTITLEATLS